MLFTLICIVTAKVLQMRPENRCVSSIDTKITHTHTHTAISQDFLYTAYSWLLHLQAIHNTFRYTSRSNIKLLFIQYPSCSYLYPQAFQFSNFAHCGLHPFSYLIAHIKTFSLMTYRDVIFNVHIPNFLFSASS